MKQTRECHRCHQNKPATPEFFGRHPSCALGLESICKACKKEARAHRSPEEKARDKARLRAVYEARKGKQQEAREAKRKTNPAEFAARQRRWREKQTPDYIEQTRLKSRARYQKTRDALLLKKKETRLALRLEMIAAYGGKCKCCGEDNPRFLTIDHVHGNGRLHRELAGGSGNTIYLLKSEGWPQEGLQLLCFNCNCGRAYNGGICPHVTAGNLPVSLPTEVQPTLSVLENISSLGPG